MNIEHGDEYNNQQQAHMNTSEFSDQEVADAPEYVPHTILSKSKYRNKKKVI